MPISSANFYTPKWLAGLMESVLQIMISLRCIVTGENIREFTLFKHRAAALLKEYPLQDENIKNRIKEAAAAPRTTAGYKLREGIGVLLLCLFLILPSIALDAVTLAGMVISAIYNGSTGLFSSKAPNSKNDTAKITKNNTTLYNGLEMREGFTSAETKGYLSMTTTFDNIEKSSNDAVTNNQNGATGAQATAPINDKKVTFKVRHD